MEEAERALKASHSLGGRWPNGSRKHRCRQMGLISSQIRNSSSRFSETFLSILEGFHGLQQIRRHSTGRLQRPIKMPAHQWLCIHEEPRRQKDATPIQQPQYPLTQGISGLHAWKWRWIIEHAAKTRNIYGYIKRNKPRRSLCGYSPWEDQANPAECYRDRKRYFLQGVGSAQEE